MKIAPFLLFLKKNYMNSFTLFVFVPLMFVLFQWLFGMSLKTACVGALTLILMFLVSKYGAFETSNDSAAPVSLIGLGLAFIFGYVVFLLLSLVAVSPMGPSAGYFYACFSICWYHAGRYEGINGYFPFAREISAYLGVRLPEKRRTRDRQD